jgi:para-aminobenzoate synthetase/4-amino-4-deoxychorismate lyase
MFVCHKTSHRSVYDQAMAEVPRGTEPLLVNELGHVTESAIANVVYEIGGQLYTPPVSDGLLPGVLRGVLIREGKIIERSLSVTELGDVTGWWLVNALRGWREAKLVSATLPDLQIA